MGRKRLTPDSILRTSIKQLFCHPPVSASELEQRLAGLDAARTRALLVQRLEQGLLLDRQVDLFQAAMRLLGVGAQGLCLASIALDRSRRARDRVFALMALTAAGPKPLHSLARELPPADFATLAEVSLLQLFVLPPDSGPGEAVAAVLREAPNPEERLRLADAMERCRREVGVAAAASYGAALTSPSLGELRGRLLDFLVRDASADSIALLERLRDRAPDDSTRGVFQKAALKARSQALDPGRASAGCAFLGNCDGQGAYILFGCLENPGGTHTLVDLCIRAGADIRDGFVLSSCAWSEIESLIAQVKHHTGSDLVRISLVQAAWLVDAAVERTRTMGIAIPPEAQESVAAFSSVIRMGEPEPLPAKPASPPGLDEAKTLLERPEYGSWIFEPGDLLGKRPGALKPSRFGRKWLAAAVKRLDKAATRRRLLGMLDTMAHWHFWRGEAALASLCLGFADQVAHDFQKSPLVTAMLERSALNLEDQQETAQFQVGDPRIRKDLRATFFGGLETPAGTDLAQLDFSEAAHTCLQTILDLLPSERWPREQERLASAFAVGKLMAEYLTGPRKGSLEHLAGKMTRALRPTSRLTLPERKRVVARVLPELAGFVKGVCLGCPVQCLEHPDDDLSAAFFADGHPSLKPNLPGP